MHPSTPTKRPLRYRTDRLIRDLVMGAITRLLPAENAREIYPSGRMPKRILLVRPNFRIGNAILTLPAIAAFHKKFPAAKIDFVGSPISRLLFQNQPLAQHYEASRRFPQVLWEYASLLRRLRANRYDLAVDVSCSQSGLASFIMALSGARVRIGCAGKWDQAFNFKVTKLGEVNKYRKLTEFLKFLCLEGVDEIGSLKFTPTELSLGRSTLEAAVGKSIGPVVGVFVGGRKLRGKRWPIENFVAVADGLSRRGCKVITFVGPEEADMVDDLKDALGAGAIVTCEPSLRKFAAILSHLALFICCDSGPMHLACTVGTRVLAIFRARDVARWAPPAQAARIVCGDQTVSAEEVLNAALEELNLEANSLIERAEGALRQTGQA